MGRGLASPQAGAPHLPASALAVDTVMVAVDGSHRSLNRLARAGRPALPPCSCAPSFSSCGALPPCDAVASSQHRPVPVRPPSTRPGCCTARPSRCLRGPAWARVRRMREQRQRRQWHLSCINDLPRLPQMRPGQPPLRPTMTTQRKTATVRQLPAAAHTGQQPTRKPLLTPCTPPALAACSHLPRPELGACRAGQWSWRRFARLPVHCVCPRAAVVRRCIQRPLPLLQPAAAAVGGQPRLLLRLHQQRSAGLGASGQLSGWQRQRGGEPPGGLPRVAT